MPARKDFSEQLRFNLVEVGAFVRQDQQHIGPFAQRQLDNCALQYLHRDKVTPIIFEHSCESVSYFTAENMWRQTIFLNSNVPYRSGRDRDPCGSSAQPSLWWFHQHETPATWSSLAEKLSSSCLNRHIQRTHSGTAQ